MSRCYRSGIFAFMTLFVVGWSFVDVEARPFRPGLLPNGNVNSCANCHVNPGGGGRRNAFGQAVESRVSPNGQEAFWGPALAALDSDGDGVSNGQELGDPDGDGTTDPSIQVTLPGDPTSFAQVTQPPAGGGQQPPAGGGDTGGQEPTVELPTLEPGQIQVLIGDAELAEGAKNDPIDPGMHTLRIRFGSELVMAEIVDGGGQGGPGGPGGEGGQGTLGQTAQQIGGQVGPGGGQGGRRGPLGRIENFEIVFRPAAVRVRVPGSVTVSDDLKEITIMMDVVENETFQIVMGEYPGQTDESVGLFYYGGTVALMDGGVTGTITLPEGVDIAQVEGSLQLLPANAEELVLAGEARGVGGTSLRLARIADDGTYSFAFVSDGDYLITAAGTVEDPDDAEDAPTLRLMGIYDADGDGNFDPVSVSGGVVTEGIDLSVRGAGQAVTPLVVSFSRGGEVMEEDVANSPLEAGPQTLELVFSNPLNIRVSLEEGIDIRNTDFAAFPFSILSNVPSTDVVVSDDRTRLSAPLELAENATYQFIIGPDVPFEDLQVYYVGST
ncbi:MAG: hypothetical protein O7G87_01955, partial [bacterium]|nr:hypothetical protein [bacterium]